MARDFPHVEVFKGADDDYYWRIKATNGEELARSSEGYDSRYGALEGFFTTREAMGRSTIDADG